MSGPTFSGTRSIVGNGAVYHTFGTVLQKVCPLLFYTAELDDDFATPLSTPPNEPVENSSSKTSITQPPDISSLDTVDFGSAVTETALRERMYDKYQLDMSDLQVLVGKATDNWRMAHTKGSGHLQVLEKFTISVQLERRLTFTTDPQWPSATVAGNLPSLSIHINEKKVRNGNLHCIEYVQGSCSMFLSHVIQLRNTNRCIYIVYTSII